MTSTVPRVAPNDGDVVRFPFSAVVGHDDLRLALLLNAVHPGVGGVLVRGRRARRSRRRCARWPRCCRP